MIDIITEKELNLKNVTQIGTPSEEEKIYIEDGAYARIHTDDFQEMRVFVLMGHTTCDAGKYTTFVEAALPVREIEFEERTPVWTNRVWSEVFHEIKYSFEKSIIVGWALDIKGVAPTVTPELEAIHREHFGGVHQILLLMDSVGPEEYFYLNKNNHLYRKDGFYIFYSAGKRNVPQRKEERAYQINISPEYFPSRRNKMEKKQETEQKMTWKNEKKSDYPRRTSARQLLMEQQSRTGSPSGSRSSALGVVVALALLVGIVATAYYKNPQQFDKLQQVVATFGNRILPQDEKTQDDRDIIYLSTEPLTPTEQEGTPTEAANGQAVQGAGEPVQEEQGAGEPVQEEQGAGEQEPTEAAAIIPVEKIDGAIPSEK